MAKNLATHINRRETPQHERMPGEQGTRRVANSAGGFSFQVDKWERLQRFLILGSEGGSYYAGERELTRDNAKAVEECAAEDFDRTLRTILEISEGGRAPKNGPAVLALALLASLGPPNSSKVAEVLPRVARISTDLFHFAEMLKSLRGRGRSFRRAVQNWYLSKDARQVAYQATKYAQRDGWTHADTLRLVKPKTDDAELDGVFAYVTDRDWRNKMPGGEARTLLEAAEEAKAAKTKETIVALIRENGLVRECIPTNWLNEPEVWEALLEKMPMGAMVRNLGKMGSVGLLTPMGVATATVIDRLRNPEAIRKSRLHPLGLLMALTVYQQGHGFKGKLHWSPDSQIIDALDEAFYMAFDNVESTGQRHLLAIDVSGSMGHPPVAGSFLSPRSAAAAMAMVTIRAEQKTHPTAFSAGGGACGMAGWPSPYPSRFGGLQDGITPISLTARARLDHAVRTINALPMGGTDCALPMLYALERQILADVFVIYTDSETWAGNMHPVQALRKYREQMNPKAKLIVVGLVANDFSIADPQDAGMLDVVGFDAGAPAVMADFIKA